jgi:ABC-type lipoprotein release transport system permease subunit
MASDGNPETVVGQQVTSGFFDLLGVRPIAGRTFVAGEDPVTFVAVPVVLIVTAAIAVAAPAWRAARVDPVVAFRTE